MPFPKHPLDATKTDITPQATIHPTAHNDLATAANQLEDRLAGLGVNVKDPTYGAVGDGVADDTAAIQAAIAASIASQRTVFFPAGTYIWTPNLTSTTIGSDTVLYLADPHDGISLLGDNGATLKLADNVSTDASPVQVSFLWRKNAKTTGVTIKGLTFDMNKANNPISPDRGIGVYNKWKHAVVWWEANDGGVEDFEFSHCTVQNSNGSNCLLTARVITASTIYSGAKIHDCIFRDNGFDTNDHSTVFAAYTKDVEIYNCLFEINSAVPSVPSAFEFHGSNSYFHHNTVRGSYYRGGFLSTNMTEAVVSNLNVHDNTFHTKSSGCSLFRSVATAPSLNPLENVNFYNNTVVLDDDTQAGAITEKAGFMARPDNGVTDVVVYGNTVIFEGSSTNNYGISIRQGEAAAPMDNISFDGNWVYNARDGAHISTTAGTDYVDDVHVRNNRFFDCNRNGVRAVGNATHPINYLEVVGNSFIDKRAVPAFVNGVFLSGAIARVKIQANSYKNLTGSNIDKSGATITTEAPENVYEDVARTVSSGKLAIGGFELGESGTDNLTASLVNGWTATEVLVRRKGNTVFWDIRGLNGAAATADTFVTLPAGFRPSNVGGRTLLWNGTGVGATAKVIITTSAGVCSADRATVTNGFSSTPWFTEGTWPA